MFGPRYMPYSKPEAKNKTITALNVTLIVLSTVLLSLALLQMLYVTGTIAAPNMSTAPARFICAMVWLLSILALIVNSYHV